MHSSRMHTARLLPVSPSMHCGGGSAPGVSAPGGVILGGSAPGGMCISACNGADTPPSVDRILDTHFWKYYLAPTTGMHFCLYYLWLGIYCHEPHWIGITNHHWFRSLMLIQLCQPDMCWREDSLKWILFHAPLFGHGLFLDSIEHDFIRIWKSGTDKACLLSTFG